MFHRLIFKVFGQTIYLNRGVLFQIDVKSAAFVPVETIQSDAERGDVPRHFFKSLNHPVEFVFMDNAVEERQVGAEIRSLFAAVSLLEILLNASDRGFGYRITGKNQEILIEMLPDVPDRTQIVVVDVNRFHVDEV
ncbi:hypothetical protein D3C87_1478640 [compost metagenome]